MNEPIPVFDESIEHIVLDYWYDLQRQPSSNNLPWMISSDMEVARPIIRRIPGSDMEVARPVIRRSLQPMVGHYRLWLATAAAQYE